MCKCKACLDGSVQHTEPNPCVSHNLLTEIHSWRISGASVDDVVDCLRLRCVPSGYVPHPWSEGVYIMCTVYTGTTVVLSYCIYWCVDCKVETREDKLRSILAQLEYSFKVCEYHSNGVPFRTNIYVPECHPISKAEFHE